MSLLYFAYGANMNHAHMKERCAQSRFLRRAYLEDYKFVYDGYSDYMRRRSLANVVNSEGGVVWGGLYEIDDCDVASLDASESCPSFEKKTAKVKDEDGKSYEAIFYLRKKKEELGAPSMEYRQTVIQGAKDCKLPAQYTMRITYRING